MFGKETTADITVRPLYRGFCGFVHILVAEKYQKQVKENKIIRTSSKKKKQTSEQKCENEAVNFIHRRREPLMLQATKRTDRTEESIRL